MVQSASVEEDMSQHQQPVPIEEITPTDNQTEINRSVPLPPPIIPETEESTLSPVSDASSGYMSNSISTVTLSDVYTLSWDLPPSSGFEVVLDEEEDVKKSTDLPKSELENTSFNSSLTQQETNNFSSVVLKEREEPDPVVESDMPGQTKLNFVSAIDCVGSEQLGNSEHLVQNDETKQTECPPADHSKSETFPTEELAVAAADKTEFELSLHNKTVSAQEGQSLLKSIVPQPEQPQQEQKTFDSAQDPGSKPGSASAPDPPEDFVLQDSTKEQSTSDSNGTSTPASSSSTEVAPSDASIKVTTAPVVPLSSVQPSKAAALVSNPFKIQKVKSSDLKSFQRILGEEEGVTPGQVDKAYNTGTGLNLSVPMESLEVISDSEEGDGTTATILPDWLKNGEFVTVGTNKSGIVRYVGPTDFAEGTWVGVELEVPAGKNDGSVGGKHYFHCNPGYGVLVRPDRVTRGGAKHRRQQQQQKRRSAILSGSSPNLAALTALAKGEVSGASTSRSRGENRKSWNP